jgi:hypothetical protein
MFSTSAFVGGVLPQKVVDVQAQKVAAPQQLARDYGKRTIVQLSRLLCTQGGRRL